MGLIDKLNQMEKERDRSSILDYALWRKHPWVGGVLFAFPFTILIIIWMFIYDQVKYPDKLLAILGIIGCVFISLGLQLFTIPFICSKLQQDPKEYFVGKKKTMRIKWLIVGIAICIASFLLSQME